jgi:hypothetical protein
MEFMTPGGRATDSIGRRAFDFVLFQTIPGNIPPDCGTIEMRQRNT